MPGQLDLVAAPVLVAPDEVADLVAWVAGPSAGYVNGASLTMDGGWTAR